jgi:hypothetical protein
MQRGVTRWVAVALGAALLGLSSGCASFGGGAATGAAIGAAGAGAAYEYQNKRQLERLDDDFERGRISRDEYERRRREIDKGSLLY